MLFSPRVLSTAAALALTCVVSAAAYYYKSRTSEINEVMVFCKLQFNAYNYFDKLISFIEEAKQSVNVCMPGIHNPAIQARLVQLIKRKNVKIRFIMDRTGINGSTRSFVKELSDAGAEIKCKVESSSIKMQHKFCLVDDRILMTGTLNWGNDMSSDNWNYVYITSKPQLVDPVKREFYHMWEQYPNDAWQTLLNNSELFDSDSDQSETINSDISGEFENLNLDSKILRDTEITPELCI